MSTITNTKFNPDPWNLGTPVSWVPELNGWIRSLGGLSELRHPVSLSGGTLAFIVMDVENPDSSELAISLGGVVYDDVPSTGQLVIPYTLPYAASNLIIKDVSGEGSLRITNVHILV